MLTFCLSTTLNYEPGISTNFVIKQWFLKLFKSNLEYKKCFFRCTSDKTIFNLLYLRVIRVITAKKV